MKCVTECVNSVNSVTGLQLLTRVKHILVLLKEDIDTKTFASFYWRKEK